MYTTDLNLVITVPADVLAPNGARPSAGTYILDLNLLSLCLQMLAPGVDCHQHWVSRHNAKCVRHVLFYIAPPINDPISSLWPIGSSSNSLAQPGQHLDISSPASPTTGNYNLTSKIPKQEHLRYWPNDAQNTCGRSGIMIAFFFLINPFVTNRFSIWW